MNPETSGRLKSGVVRNDGQIPGILNYNSDANLTNDQIGKRPVTGGKLISNTNQPLKSNLVDQSDNPDREFSSGVIDTRNVQQLPPDLQLKASKSVVSSGYGPKVDNHVPRPSKSYLTSNKLSTSFKKSKMASVSVGPVKRPGAGRAELLTNGYKSLRAQGMLRATRIPDDAGKQLYVQSDDEEPRNQSQTNILTNNDGSTKVELIEQDTRDKLDSNRSNRNPLVPQGLSLN